MATDSILRTYGDASRRDSVMPLIEYITAEETSFLTSLGRTKATDMVHATLLDTLATAASLAVEEAADYTATATTTPSRLNNLVEVVAKNFKVSRSQAQITKWNGENELARQTTKALKDWKNAAEFDLVRSTLVSGASGTVPKMEGLIAHISKSTNTTAQTSGTTWSASILKGLMKTNMDNSNGDVATDVYMGSYLKNVTDDFTNKATNVVSGTNAKEIILAVDVFQTGLGKVNVHFHRYVQQSGDATGRVLAINPDKHKIAFLQEPMIDQDLARSGDYDNRAVVGKLTLATANQDSNWFASGYNIG